MVRDRRNAPTLISLFTGAGGLDIGLEDAGFTTLVANELELHACETLRANQILPTLKGRAFAQWFEQQARQRCYEGDSEVIETLKRRLLLSRPRPYLEQTRVIQGDVRELASADLLDVSGLRRGDLCLLAGGPPCQPFSRAGKREAVQVADGRLFLEFVRLVRDLRPRWFLFAARAYAQAEIAAITATSLVPVFPQVCRACGAAWVGVWPQPTNDCPHDVVDYHDPRTPCTACATAVGAEAGVG